MLQTLVRLFMCWEIDIYWFGYSFICISEKTNIFYTLAKTTFELLVRFWWFLYQSRSEWFQLSKNSPTELISTLIIELFSIEYALVSKFWEYFRFWCSRISFIRMEYYLWCFFTLNQSKLRRRKPSAWEILQKNRHSALKDFF